jgi:hypothetical protein
MSVSEVGGKGVHISWGRTEMWTLVSLRTCRLVRGVSVKSLYKAETPSSGVRVP